MEAKKEYRRGLKDGIPIGLGYLSVSFTFGMMAAAAGVPPVVAVLISLTNLTSAGQFAGLSLMIAHGSLIEMALTQLTINLRYALMSLSLSQKLEPGITIVQRCLVAFGNTDEIFALASGQEGKVSRWFMYGLMTLPIICWTSGTLLGAVANSLLPDLLRSALGIAIYGMFLAIIIPPAKKNKVVLAVVLGAMAVSGLFSVVPILKKVSSGFVIIITTLLVAGAAAYFCPVQEVKETEEREGKSYES